MSTDPVVDAPAPRPATTPGKGAARDALIVYLGARTAWAVGHLDPELGAIAQQLFMAHWPELLAGGVALLTGARKALAEWRARRATS